jgi:hypothetical protein
LVSQQYGSVAQILATQGLHDGESFGPCEQSLWEHVVVMPQEPPAHTPLQHSAGFVQGVPSSMHMKGPQWLVGLQGPLQHFRLGLQRLPLGTQAFGPQTPLVQTLEQHGAPLHGKPSRLHFGAPQTPLGPQVPEQQSWDEWQRSPSCRHIGLCSQTPPWQIWVQQSAAVLQLTPTAPHIPPHTPPLHTPSQQSAGVVQLAPTGLHMPLSSPPVPGDGWYRRLLLPQLASRKGPVSNAATKANTQA